MSQFSLVYLFVFIAIFSILIYLLLIKNKTLQIKACIFLLVSYLTTLFCFIIYLSAKDTHTMRLWLNISHYTGPIANSMVLYLIVIFYYNDKKPPLVLSLCILLSVVPLLLRGILGFMNTVTFIPNTIGNIAVYRHTVFFYYYYIHTIIIALITIIFLIVKYRTSKIRRLKKLSSLLLIATGLTWVSGISAEFLITYYFEKKGILVPATGYLSYLIILTAFFYALGKYSFMKNSIPYSIDSIMSKISDSVIITDTEGGIVQANKAAFAAFAMSNDSLGNLNLISLFPAALEDFMQDINSTSVSGGFKKLPHPEKQNHILDVSIESIYDNFGDYIGKLVICRTNNKFEESQRKFNLTIREIEIITLLYDGLEYQEIAERLNISANTVRNHIQNIFTKTGAGNKARLLKIVF
jgi:DNA-binding CsgD family transcriptional regulator